MGIQHVDLTWEIPVSKSQGDDELMIMKQQELLLMFPKRYGKDNLFAKSIFQLQKTL